MGFWLLVFFSTPIIEMYLLITVGGYIGALPTIALVMLTAVVGVALLRAQGLQTLTRGRMRLESGELPAREVAEGLLLAVAGALLITPGFVTDTLGFLLLIPPVRGVVARRVLDRIVVVGRDGDGRPRSAGRSYGGPGTGDSEGGRVIEGEFESRTEPDDDATRHRRP